MKRIAFVRSRYLNRSETFIYEELIHIRRYRAIVYARIKRNLKRFPYPYIKRLKNNPKKMARRFKRDRIRLIHARFGTAGVKLIKVKKRLGLPMITSFHGFDLPMRRQKKKTYHRRLSKLFKAGDKFTVPSKQMKRLLIRWGCPSSKIVVMYSGIDPKKFPYINRAKRKNKRVRILCVGRLHQKKGMSYLLKAFKRVHRKQKNTELVIVGEGKERKKLERIIRRYKLNGCVKLKGDRSPKQVADEMKKADIFCLLSVTTKDGNHEGIPNALKEAMSTGLPVVATRHGGIPELVTHGREGYLVPERNVKKAAKRLNQLVRNRKKRLAMGKKGRRKVKRYFNVYRQTAKLERLYDRLLRKK
jgi:glycosyltransferase involved in cell wall biosynthesis